MSMRHVLEEQIERNQKNINAYMKRINKLPKGTLHAKKRGKREYYYLKYRDASGKRIDEYVKAVRVDVVRKQIRQRDKYKNIVKGLKEDIVIAKKGLRILQDKLENLHLRWTHLTLES